ncbi:hypothetical protein ACFFRR_008937 [Megaselia abdita]
MIEEVTTKVTGNCLKLGNDPFCSQNKDLVEVKKLQKEIADNLNYIYQTLGKKVDDSGRRRRALGMVLGGMALNFGIENHKALGQISGGIDQLRSTFKNNLDIVKSEVTNQQKINEILKEQLEGLASRVNIHKNNLNNAHVKVKNLEQTIINTSEDVNKLKMETTFHGIRVDVLEISEALKEIKQAIHDLTVNLLHSMIMSPEEIMRKLQIHRNNENFLTVPHLFNYPKLAETIIGQAELDTDTDVITIYIEVPLYDKHNRLYEVISVPMIRDNKILFVSSNDKYCVIAENKRQYYCMAQEHDYKKIDDFYVCGDHKKLSFLPTSNRNKCIINIFRGRSFDNCDIREIPDNIEIFKKLEPNTHLFALRDLTTYKYECMNETHQWNNFDRVDSFSSTGVLYMGPGCKLYTKDTFIESDKLVPLQYKQKYDAYNFGLDSKIEREFEKYVFSKNIPQEKRILKFDFLKFLENDNEVTEEILN